MSLAVSFRSQVSQGKAVVWMSNKTKGIGQFARYMMLYCQEKNKYIVYSVVSDQR